MGGGVLGRTLGINTCEKEQREPGLRQRRCSNLGLTPGDVCSLKSTPRAVWSWRHKKVESWVLILPYQARVDHGRGGSGQLR